MNQRWTFAGVLTLSVGLLMVSGCQKKPPKGAQKVEPAPQTAQPGPEAAPVAEDGTITLGPLTAKLPAGWQSVAPNAPMRKAEIQIPATDEGGIPGTITVFYFGPQAGSVDMNIERWVGQFEQPGGEPLTQEMVKRETFTANGLEVTMVSFAGTQRASQMPGSVQMHALSGFMNVSGIVVTPDGPWFFKGTGPEKLMSSNHANFKTFLKSMEYHGQQAASPQSAQHGMGG